MRKLIKICCMAAACFMALSGCSGKLEHVERNDSDQLEQSGTDDKIEKSIAEERIDLSDSFYGMNGCAVFYISI